MIKTKELIEKLKKCGLDKISTDTIAALCGPEPEYVPEHADAGYNEEGAPCMAVEIGESQNHRMTDVGTVFGYFPRIFGGWCHVKRKAFNVFDWLAEWKKPFERKNVVGVDVEITTDEVRVGTYYFTPDQAKEAAKTIMHAAIQI